MNTEKHGYRLVQRGGKKRKGEEGSRAELPTHGASSHKTHEHGKASGAALAPR